jgi:predicted nucleic acid-binding protein
MILVDTSVWIDHFREGIPALAVALDQDIVFTHPLVVGELACGNLRNRAELFALLDRLPVAPLASDAEALQLIERRMLMGRGIGYIDVHLLASAALTHDARIWTRDRRLASVALELNLGMKPEFFLRQPRAAYRVGTRPRARRREARASG